MPMIFVDTWAWLALNDENDQDHQQVKQAHAALTERNFSYVTTNFILDEAYTLLRRRTYSRRVIEFGREIQEVAAADVITLISITPEIERKAWKIFEMYVGVDKLSYTDCTLFAVMQQLGLRIAFTADQHFTMLGFELYPPAA